MLSTGYGGGGLAEGCGGARPLERARDRLHAAAVQHGQGREQCGGQRVVFFCYCKHFATSQRRHINISVVGGRADERTGEALVPGQRGLNLDRWSVVWVVAGVMLVVLEMTVERGRGKRTLGCRPLTHPDLCLPKLEPLITHKGCDPEVGGWGSRNPDVHRIVVVVVMMLMVVVVVVVVMMTICNGNIPLMMVRKWLIKQCGCCGLAERPRVHLQFGGAQERPRPACDGGEPRGRGTRRDEIRPSLLCFRHIGVYFKLFLFYFRLTEALAPGALG
jgi:hypothetical protein